MKNQIIINAKGNESRIALIENGELSQFFVESPEVIRSVGDIYLAEVHKVMGGIRAAFIDIGQAKDAFLHFSDVGEHLIDYVQLLNGPDALNHVNPELIRKIRSEQKGQMQENEASGLEKQGRAAEILRPGQKMLVQIVKEPMGSKGPRVSTDISLAGRFVVLIPFGNYVAVSKRIRSHKERRRLRSLVNEMLPPQFGVIVRTVAGGQRDEMIVADLQELLDKWNAITSQMHTAKPPVVLHRDLDMTESLVRDLFAKDYDRILVDDPAKYKQIRKYVEKIAPKLLPNLKAYKGKEHIFDFMKIAADVESIYTPRVKMKSGGYLIFEQTEAMYVIDVNSGRYAAKKNQEENSLKTNLEAAREIAKQLRLRDIGGIIVVDFIDLKELSNRKKVFDELKKEFRKDKAKTNVLEMSDFGLVQITRQRIRPSINSSISKVCPMCGGTGDVVSQNTIITDIDAWLTKFRHLYKYRKLDLYVNPYLRSFLTRGFISKRIQWMVRYLLRISIYADETISMNDFKFTLSGSEIDITDAVLNDQPIDLTLKQAEESLSKSRRDPSKLDIYGNDDGADWSGIDDDDSEDDDEDAKLRTYREDARRDRGDNRREFRDERSDDRRGERRFEPEPRREARDERGRVIQEARDDRWDDQNRSPREARDERGRVIQEPREERREDRRRPDNRRQESRYDVVPPVEATSRVQDFKRNEAVTAPRLQTPIVNQAPQVSEQTAAQTTASEPTSENTSSKLETTTVELQSSLPTNEVANVSTEAPAPPESIAFIAAAAGARNRRGTAKSQKPPVEQKPEVLEEQETAGEEESGTRRKKNLKQKYYRKDKGETDAALAEENTALEPPTFVEEQAPVAPLAVAVETISGPEAAPKPPVASKPGTRKKPIRKPRRGSPDDLPVDSGDDE